MDGVDDPPPTPDYAPPPARGRWGPYDISALIGLGVGLLIGTIDVCGIFLCAILGGFTIGAAGCIRATARPFLPGPCGNAVALTVFMVISASGANGMLLGINSLVGFAVLAATWFASGLIGGFVGASGKRLDDD